MSFLRPNHNVWRVERAARAAVLIDAAAFFGAVRGRFPGRAAQHLRGRLGHRQPHRAGRRGRRPTGCRPPSPLPSVLVRAARAARPSAAVGLLAGLRREREQLPRLHLDWQMPQRRSLCSTTPSPSAPRSTRSSSSSTMRWPSPAASTSPSGAGTPPAHAVEQAARVDPDGKPYKPFHDVQMMVDGRAAQALAELARQRWCRGQWGRAASTRTAIPGRMVPGLHGRRYRHRAHPAALDGETPVREVERCSSIPSIGPSARSTSRTSSRPRRGSPSVWPIACAAPRAGGRDRGAAATIPCREADDAQRPHPLLATRARGRWRPRASRLSRRRAGRPQRRHHDPFQGDDHRRSLSPHRFGQSQQPLDGRRHRMRPGHRGGNDRQRAAIAAVRNRLLGEHCGVPAEEVAALARLRRWSCGRHAVPPRPLPAADR